MSCLAGVPAFYYNSLVAAPNNVRGLEETKRNRVINRKKWSEDEINARFAASDSVASKVLKGIQEFLAVRTQYAAFHPEAVQEAVAVHHGLFVLRRRSLDGQETIACVFNLTPEPGDVATASILASDSAWPDVVYQAGHVEMTQDRLYYGPYAMCWLRAA